MNFVSLHIFHFCTHLTFSWEKCFIFLRLEKRTITHCSERYICIRKSRTKKNFFNTKMKNRLALLFGKSAQKGGWLISFVPFQKKTKKNNFSPFPAKNVISKKGNISKGTKGYFSFQPFNLFRNFIFAFILSFLKSACVKLFLLIFFMSLNILSA